MFKYNLFLASGSVCYYLDMSLLVFLEGHCIVQDDRRAQSNNIKMAGNSYGQPRPQDGGCA
jgi:hypothetical protein